MKSTTSQLYKASIGLLLLYILVAENIPNPHAASQGSSLLNQNTLPASAESQFTVATYNIRRSKGLDDKRDINRAITILRDSNADIVGLNELSGTLFYGMEDQATQMGRALDFGWLFAPTYELLFQDYFGNGLLSRWPVSSWQIHPLVADDTPKQSFRNYIVATLPIGEVELHVLVTHLDRSAVRPKQLQQVLAHFMSLDKPAILLGDLNTPRSDPKMTHFFNRYDASDAIGIFQPNKQKSKKRRVDWIISRGLRLVDGGMHERGVSDHPAYWGTFALSGK